ncbi:MAG: DUF362 domain-containing protein [Bacteroidetes bacterium]|nr:DUF362 domain-containing protein [Bacteroidota bacterium]
MKRREFIIKSVTAGATVGLTTLPVFNIIGASKKSTTSVKYDLVAIRGGEPDVMFNRAIQSLGGLSNFVKPNQTVVIKPNIGWDVVPERAANTNPILIKEIVKQCYGAGAKEVFVFDHTCDEWSRCYSNSGIKSAAESAGATVVPGNYEKYYQKVDIPKGINMKDAKVHELILDSDVFINVPILKHHGGAQLSLGMKNLMGVVWDRQYWHRNNLHQCIADFVTWRKPHLTVIDGYLSLKRNGPRGVSTDDVITMKTQIISADIVAADAAAAKFFGEEPEKIGHIKIAGAMKSGVINLDKLSIDRIKL